MARHISLFFLLISSVFFGAEFCYFLPPSGWEIAHLKVPSPYVQIGFIGKGSTEFRPSINLATEEIDVSLKEYIKAVKEQQTADPMIQWHDLGKFPMRGGIGRLIEMTNTSPWGETKIFQAILVKGEKAYILTGAVLKEDLSKFQTALLNSFRSLTVISDLSSLIPDQNKQKEFKTFFASLGSAEEAQEWENLQKQVNAHSQLGPYWQFLALREGRAQISKSKE